MKILVFSDVHGSLNALRELVKTRDWLTVDKRVFLGDVCIGCSRPNECVKLLNELDCYKIFGNNDRYVFDHVPDVDFLEFEPGKIAQLDYMKNNVSTKNKKIMAGWHKDLMLEIVGKKFYFTHYPWEIYDGDENVIDTPKEKSFSTRKAMFAGVDADYIFFGHEHRANNCTDGKQHFYCVGTLGLKNPGYYMVIDVLDNGIEVKENYIAFDINEEVKLMDKAGYPYNKNKINN